MMGRLYQCDWCGAVFDDRDALLLMDLGWKDDEDRQYVCPDHPPEHQVNLPRDPDSGQWLHDRTGEPLPDPVITPEEAQDLGIAPGER